ncbi:MAG TPA: tRNA 2-thiouridine(34) synthase MnmA [Phycisphaerales bacterium]|nr:tRNA 2-thiouridine(34) synthase MnmA [Phycisphaerales bacterium]
MPPPPAHSKGKVLVAMSGGVDSSVAAALLVREGYEVVGVFMRLGSPGDSLDTMQAETSGSETRTTQTCDPKKIKIGHQGCCSINDAADARLVAAELGIPFYVVNFKKDFGRIIDYFVDEYAAGRTPNPCVRCNDWLKFGKLHEYAGQIGARWVASGHYARVIGGTDLQSRASGAAALHGSGEPCHPSRLLRGLDHTKDQSYVLFGVPREQLSRMLLPIGGFPKTEVRAMAAKFGLPTFDKPDSQEICFVPDNDYAGLVERRRPELARAGAIVDEAGQRVGEHAGQHRFTVGQRRGLGVGSVTADVPLFVLRKEAAGNRVVVGPRERLAASGCVAGEANWLCDETMLREWTPVMAKYRYNTRAVPARVRVIAGLGGATPSGRRGRFEIAFDEPQRAVAPGQAIVLYDAGDGEVVLGGGWIDRATGS